MTPSPQRASSVCRRREVPPLANVREELRLCSGIPAPTSATMRHRAPPPRDRERCDDQSRRDGPIPEQR